MDATQAIELINYEAIAVVSEDRPNPGSLISTLSTVVPIDMSDGFGDVEATIGELGQLHEIEPGEEAPSDEFRSAWNKPVKFRHFARSTFFTQRDYQAAQAKGKLPGIVQKVVQSWQRNWDHQKEEAFITLYLNGGLTAGHADFNATHKGYADATGDLLYDGVSMFNAAHPLKFKTPTVISNVEAVAFSDSALDSAVTAFTTDMAVSDRGRNILQNPTHVLVGPALRRSVSQVLGSTQVVGSNNNEINTNFGIVQPAISTFMNAQPTAWVLVNADMGREFFDSGSLVISTWVDPSTDNVHLKCQGLYGQRVSDWRHARGHNIATS